MVKKKRPSSKRGDEEASKPKFSQIVEPSKKAIPKTRVLLAPSLDAINMVRSLREQSDGDLGTTTGGSSSLGDLGRNAARPGYAGPKAGKVPI